MTEESVSFDQLKCDNTFSRIFNNDFCNCDLTLNICNVNDYKKNGKYILQFVPSDTKELFEINLKSQPENWYYRTHSVNYTLNSYGYRTEEFYKINWKESIVMFGCSHVFGIGVDDTHTIPYFLEQISGRPVVNFGYAGSSIQTVLHNGLILKDSKYPTPKVVIPVWTNLNRYQIYGKNQITHYGDWNSDEKFSSIDTICRNLMHIKMFRNLWKNDVIYKEFTPYHLTSEFVNKIDYNIFCHKLFSSNDFNLSNKSRDLIHRGRIDNFNAAKKIYKLIKSELG
jgi:hypothetical protein